MSYEYKEILKVAARDFLTGNLQQDSETGEYLNLGEVEENYSDISIELDLVYAQAAKADEYEAKAKDFDEISFVFVDSLAHDYDDHSIAQNIAMVIENEKGDYYV